MNKKKLRMLSTIIFISLSLAPVNLAAADPPPEAIKLLLIIPNVTIKNIIANANTTIQQILTLTPDSRGVIILDGKILDPKSTLETYKNKADLKLIYHIPTNNENFNYLRNIKVSKKVKKLTVRNMEEGRRLSDLKTMRYEGEKRDLKRKFKRMSKKEPLGLTEANSIVLPTIIAKTSESPNSDPLPLIF